MGDEGGIQLGIGSGHVPQKLVDGGRLKEDAVVEGVKAAALFFNPAVTAFAKAALDIGINWQPVEKIEKSLATSTTVHVTRSEWELRNQTVDERFVNTAAAVAAVHTRIDNADTKKAPWWAVTAVIFSTISTLGLALQWVPQLVNK